MESAFVEKKWKARSNIKDVLRILTLFLSAWIGLERTIINERPFLVDLVSFVTAINVVVHQWIYQRSAYGIRTLNVSG